MTLATIGIVLLLFSTSVQACGSYAIRPISDFTDTNTDIAGWGDPEWDPVLIAVPCGSDYGAPMQHIADTIHYGFVLEKDLGDGRIMYKIFLYVKGAILQIFYNVGTWWLPDENGIYQQLMFTGEMDYFFTTTIIAHNWEFGGPVPWLWSIWFLGGGETLSQILIAYGTGILTESGAAANVKITMVGMLVDGVYSWPIETIEFY